MAFGQYIAFCSVNTMKEHGHQPKSLSGSQSQSKFLENPIPTPIAIAMERSAGAAHFAKGGLKSTLHAAIRQLSVAGPDLYQPTRQKILFFGTTNPEDPNKKARPLAGLSVYIDLCRKGQRRYPFDKRFFKDCSCFFISFGSADLYTLKNSSIVSVSSIQS